MDELTIRDGEFAKAKFHEMQNKINLLVERFKMAVDKTSAFARCEGCCVPNDQDCEEFDCVELILEHTLKELGIEE